MTRPPARRISAAGSGTSRKPTDSTTLSLPETTPLPYDPTNRCVLVADDDAAIRELLVELLRDEGYEVMQAATGKEMLAQYRGPKPPALVLMDVEMPDMSGLEALREISQGTSETSLPIVMMTAFSSASIAIEATKLGAMDYITKPFSIDEVIVTVGKFFETRAVIAEMDATPIQADTRARDEIIGSSPEITRIFTIIGKAAVSNATVLVTGESGTGKELIANVLHKNSLNSRGPLVKVNCVALPESLLESELFGHEKGAFTGAVVQHKGSFERANKGTIFLDEIGEMTPGTQSKLLRVLQEREFERVGGSVPVHVDVRVVAATNRRLEDEVANGNFCLDLFYRLNMITIHLPPLRERMEDMPLLVQHFLDKHRYGVADRPARISPDGMEKLRGHSWPGNIRELENTIQRAIVLAQGGLITADAIQFAPSAGGRLLIDIGERVRERVPLTDVLNEVEREYLMESLRHHEGNRAAVARVLGLDLPDLESRLRTFGLANDLAAD